MTIEKKLLGTNPVSGEVLPEAVSFDGTNDYLSRSSDMTNNADGKTFTFSCWVYIPSGYNGTIGVYNVGSFWIQPDKDGGLGIVGYGPSGGNPAFYSNLPANTIPLDTYSNILVSINVNGGVSTRLRHVYINDVNVTSSADWYESEGSGWYNDKLINFTPDNGTIRVGANAASQKLKGRLAHVFLDYTYRDLSTTSNRRLFIDADGKPSSTIPSSPILYLPMKDAATAGSNSGTGGDFTVNGVLATAERGPNQDNCSASKFDGSADYLSRSSISGLSDSKLFTLSFVVDGGSNHGEIFSIGTGSWPSKFSADIFDYVLRLEARGSSSNTVIMNWNVNLDQKLRGATNLITISINMANQSASKVFINGIDSGGSFATFSNVAIDFTASQYFIGKDYSSLHSNATIGELYFNTTYTDLAADNPFWDSDTNRPNSVRKVIADTSVTPLIALPMIGNDAGNNLGSGGDFTVNSGPYTHARGGSEFWARSVKFSNAETQYLNMTSPSATSGKTFTLVMLINHSTGDNGEATIAFSNSSNIVYFTVESNTSNIKIYGKNSSGSTILSGQIDGISRRQNQWDIYLISGDMTDASKFKIYFNGVNKSIASGDWSTFTNDTLGLASSTHVNIGRSNATSGQFLTGEIANVYFSNEYTDFSQEVNRNKFIDQLGYPADLGEDGSNPTGNQPYIYATMPSSNLGKNAGSGPDFTPVASPKAGEDFIPT